MKNLLFPLLRVLVLSLLVLPLLSQEGQWKASIYQHGIVKLQWQHAGIKNAEAIGDAVILSPTNGPFPITIQQQPTAPAKQHLPAEDIGKGPLLSLTKQGLKVIYGPTIVDISAAFDSGHVRGLKLRMQPDDHWFGGGERSLPLERSGQRIPLYNAPSYGYELNADALNYSVPFIINTNGYGLLFDNPSKGYIDFGKTTQAHLEAGFESGEVNVLVIPGETPAEIIGRYAELTGKQPLPPRWALGNLMSRFGYRSQQQLEDIVTNMQSNRFPIDAVIIDIFWFGDSIKGTLGNLDWMNKSKWPAPEKMLAKLRAQNIHPILVTEPFFLQGTQNFEASKPYLATNAAGEPYMLTDFYFGHGGLLDLFAPAARSWFWQFYKKQTDIGVSGWWGDLGEPEKHPADMYHNLQSFGVKRRMAANEVHNMYGHLWSRMLFENWRKHYPDRRLFYLNRAGYAGSQRYSVFPWTGDVSRTWNGLKAQLPNLQSMSLSGIPYIHSDAGGFSNVPENDQELYVRWLQMAGFTPVFRPHGTALGDLEPNVHDLPSEPVFKDEPFRSLARNVVELRYSLLPYLYTLAWEQATNGKPLIRPMILEGLSDLELLKATDQYMFGNAFLVAPVLEKGATTRRLYLPEGTWYNWQDHKLFSGRKWIEHPTTMAEMPLFVKAGSVIPMWITNQYNNTAAYTPTTSLTLRYFPGNNTTSGVLYDDDGKNPDAMEDENAHQLIEWHNKAQSNQLVLQLNARNWPEGVSRECKLQIVPNTDLPFDITQAKVTFNGSPVTLHRDRSIDGWLEFTFTYDGSSATFRFDAP